MIMKVGRLLVLSLAAFAMAVPVQAKELVYGAWVSPRHSVMRLAMPDFFAGVAKSTSNAVTWKMVAGGQLVDGKGTLSGLKNGLVDGGFLLAPYNPSYLPASNLLFNTQLFGEESMAATGAMNEMLLLGCKECIEEARKNDVIQLGSFASTPFLFMCRGELNSVADLRGKRIRSVGGGVALANLAGAVPVSMNPAEATTALQRGGLDCVHGAASFLVSYGYADVVNTVFTFPLGMGGPTTYLALGRKNWNGLTREQRQAHIDHAARSVAAASIKGYIENDKEVLASVVKRGVRLVPGGKDFEELVEKRKASMNEPNIANARKFGVKEPEAIVDAYLKAFERWKGLTEGMGSDVDRFAELLHREIYSKLDPDTI